MDTYFVEGEKTSKRVRLNKSEVLGYGSRRPTGSPPKANAHRNHASHRGSPGCCNCCCCTRSTADSSSELFVMMQELLQKTNLIADEILKLRIQPLTPPTHKCCSSPAILDRDRGNSMVSSLWEELTSMREELDMLKNTYSRSLQVDRLRPTPTYYQTWQVDKRDSVYPVWKQVVHMRQELDTLKSNYASLQQVDRLTNMVKNVKISGYTPSDPHFSSKQRHCFGKRKGSPKDVNDSISCFRTDMKSRVMKKLESKKSGHEPMDIE